MIAGFLEPTEGRILIGGRDMAGLGPNQRPTAMIFQTLALFPLIYVAAPKEQRLCLPNTRFLLHQPSGGTRGMASDIEIQAREIIKMNERLNRIFAEATGQPIEKIEL